MVDPFIQLAFPDVISIVELKHIGGECWLSELK